MSKLWVALSNFTDVPWGRRMWRGFPAASDNSGNCGAEAITPNVARAVPARARRRVSSKVPGSSAEAAMAATGTSVALARDQRVGGGGKRRGGGAGVKAVRTEEGASAVAGRRRGCGGQ